MTNQIADNLSHSTAIRYLQSTPALVRAVIQRSIGHLGKHRQRPAKQPDENNP